MQPTAFSWYPRDQNSQGLPLHGGQFKLLHHSRLLVQRLGEGFGVVGRPFAIAPQAKRHCLGEIMRVLDRPTDFDAHVELCSGRGSQEAEVGILGHPSGKVVTEQQHDTIISRSTGSPSDPLLYSLCKQPRHRLAPVEYGGSKQIVG